MKIQEASENFTTGGIMFPMSKLDSCTMKKAPQHVKNTWRKVMH